MRAVLDASVPRDTPTVGEGYIDFATTAGNSSSITSWSSSNASLGWHRSKTDRRTGRQNNRLIGGFYAGLQKTTLWRVVLGFAWGRFGGSARAALGILGGAKRVLGRFGPLSGAGSGHGALGPLLPSVPTDHDAVPALNFRFPMEGTPTIGLAAMEGMACN